jgi:hypothetical protein
LVGGFNNSWPTNPWKQPFRICTGNSYTLILMKRPNPYPLADLVRLAPQTFVRLPDDTYSLSENIFLDTGAQLNLSNPGGLIIPRASSTLPPATITAAAMR